MGNLYPRHIAGLDRIRALCALSVMISHIAGPYLGDAKYIFTGEPAVIIFFIISGFCIHYPNLSKRFHAKEFLKRRYIRILIPVLAAMGFSVFARIKGYNFWDGYILWSIVCELFYYTAYPLLRVISSYIPFQGQYLIALIISYSLALTLPSDLYGNINAYGFFLNWLLCFPAWLLGCLLAENITVSRASQSSIGFWRVAVAIMASGLYWLTMNTSVGFYLTLNLFGILAYFWVKHEIAIPQYGIFEKMGKWSYSIYLMHMPIYLILCRIFKLIVGETPYLQSFPLMAFLSLPAVLSLCYIFFLKIESPSHNLAREL